MKELWWEEAAKYQVLPLNNQPGRFGDRRYRRERYELYAGHRAAARGHRPEPAEPVLRAWRPSSPCPPTAPSDGVIVAHGGHSGGYALYLQGRRLHYVYNFLGTEITDDLGRGRAAGRDRWRPHVVVTRRARTAVGGRALLRRRPGGRGHGAAHARRSPTG